jgi:hypothetical protein
MIFELFLSVINNKYKELETNRLFYSEKTSKMRCPKLHAKFYSRKSNFPEVRRTVKFLMSHKISIQVTRSAQNRLATIRLPNAGPTTGLKSAKSRLCECRLLADFRPAVGPAFGSRMVANQIRADREFSLILIF